MNTPIRLQAFWSALFWFAVGGVAYLLGVQNELGQKAESIALDAAHFTTTPPAPLNLVSIQTVTFSVLVVAAIAFFAYGFGRAVRISLAASIAIVAAQALKLQILDRPSLFEFDAPNTFPSGHMTIFTAIFAALIWAVPARLRAVSTLVVTAVLALVAWQLLAYGWHRPSDVYGAVALTITVFATFSIVSPAKPETSFVFSRVLSIGFAICAWTFIAGAGLLTLFATTLNNLDLLLNAGQLGAIGISVLSMRSVLRASFRG